jgi:hypothetical protein
VWNIKERGEKNVGVQKNLKKIKIKINMKKVINKLPFEPVRP